jgi:hypothetical protein
MTCRLSCFSGTYRVLLSAERSHSFGCVHAVGINLTYNSCYNVLREFMPDLGQYLAKGKVRKQRKSCRRPHLRRQARGRTSEYLRHYAGNKIAIRHEGFAA